jgi:hypothetical protein
LGDLGGKAEDTIKMDIIQIGLNTVQWWILVNTVMNFWIP